MFVGVIKHLIIMSHPFFNQILTPLSVLRKDYFHRALKLTTSFHKQKESLHSDKLI